MTKENSPEKVETSFPNFYKRIASVWLRHFKVYSKTLFSNGFPPFLEPLIFLAGIGFGLGKFIGEINGINYLQFLATGVVVSSAMYTAAFECTFGTFIRLDFDNIYDGMLASSLTVKDLLIGEILFAGTKSFFFTSVVLFVISLFGLIPSILAIFAPFIGFLTGLMFGSLSLFVTSFVSTINHFNFYFTGILTPMFFFSGVIFPLDSLPPLMSNLALIFPLTHSVTLIRAFCLNSFSPALYFNLLYIFLFISFFGYLAIKRLEKRMID